MWAAQLARASMAAQAAWTDALATLWRVRRSLVCVTAPTDGRAVLPKRLRKSSAGATSAGAQDGRPQSSRAHARTTQDPFRVCHGSISLVPKGRLRPFSLLATPSARPAGWWRGWRGSRASARGPASSTCSTASPSCCVDGMQVACLVSTEKGPNWPFQRCRVWMGVVTRTRWFLLLPGPHWGAARWCKRRSELRPR